MINFKIHSQESAPEASQAILQKMQQTVGFVPGLYGVLAEAPQALEAYEVLAGLFKGTSFTTTEQHVILLTVNYENNCDYCVPAHTGLAKMDGVPDDVIDALRNGTPIADPKLEALRTFTVQVVQKRGWVADEVVRAFLSAGYAKQQILEVIVALAYKVISNYSNHIARTPVDAAFKKFEWKKPEVAEAA